MNDIEADGPTSFLDWFPKQEINEVRKLLDEKLNNEVMFLQNHIADLAVMQGTLSRLLADAQSLLDYAEQKALMERQPGQTDLDRKKVMTAVTRNERRVMNILVGFSKALRNKLIATQSLKKTLCGEITSGYKG